MRRGPRGEMSDEGEGDEGHARPASARSRDSIRSKTPRRRPLTARSGRSRGSHIDGLDGDTKVVTATYHDPRDWGRVWINTGQTYIDHWNIGRNIPEHNKSDPVKRNSFYHRKWSTSKFLVGRASASWGDCPPGGIISELGADGIVYTRPVNRQAAERYWQCTQKK